MKLWDKICILNLAKDKERLKTLKTQLKLLKLKGEKCVPATNGYEFVPNGKKIKKTKSRSLKNKLLKKMRLELTKKNILKKTKYRQLRIGEIGCHFSHKNTMKYALKKGLDRILILEDDVKFLPNFNEKLKKIEKYIPSDCDILFLGVNKINYKWGSFKQVNKYILKPKGTRIVKKYPDSNGAFYGAHAYIINRKAMKEYIDFTTPLTYPADVSLGKIGTLLKKVNIYCVKENLVTTHNFGSYTQLIK